MATLVTDPRRRCKACRARSGFWPRGCCPHCGVEVFPTESPKPPMGYTPPPAVRITYASPWDNPWLVPASWRRRTKRWWPRKYARRAHAACLERVAALEVEVGLVPLPAGHELHPVKGGLVLRKIPQPPAPPPKPGSLPGASHNPPALPTQPDPELVNHVVMVNGQRLCYPSCIDDCARSGGCLQRMPYPSEAHTPFRAPRMTTILKLVPKPGVPPLQAGYLSGNEVPADWRERYDLVRLPPGPLRPGTPGTEWR